MKLKSIINKSRESLNTKTAKIGGYTFVMAVVVLAIVVAVNVFASSLPSKFTQFDISSAQLYSLTSDSKAVVTGLDDDVTIYWICQAGQEDTIIEKLLGVYEGMSDHITVEKKDPDQYPTFASQYTDETVSNNSLIVESGDKNRYISYDNIYEYDTSSYYSSGSVSRSFDGESQITSAISYVVSDELPKIYVLTGHGEADFSTAFSSAVETANIETEDYTLLNVDEIDDEADAVLIYSPSSDLSESEIELLEKYIDNGGHVVVFSGPQQSGNLTNLTSLLNYVGVEAAEGIVIDTDRESYAFSYPYNLLPTIESSDITDALIDESKNVVMPIATGLTVGSSSNYTVTSLLDTSSESYAKAAGFAMSTWDKEDSDVDGPFSLAIAAENNSTGGSLVYVASDYFLLDDYNNDSSGANIDFATNALTWKMADNTTTLSIKSKSMSYSRLTISESQATVIKVVLIGLLPIFYLIYGIDEVYRRRKKQ